MGAWGAGIFSDDLALDVRDDYRELIGAGHEGPEATRLLMEKYRGTIEDPEQSSVFWLALAATQWKTGRLEDWVKEKALQIIDSGEDLEKWKDSLCQYDRNILRRRQAVLLKLREQLCSPQRPPVKIKKPYIQTCSFHPGEVLAYRLLSGRYALFLVVEVERMSNGGAAPVFCVLDWCGEELPDVSQISQISRFKAFPGVSVPEALEVVARSPRENRKGEATIIRIASLPELVKLAKPYSKAVTLWATLDRCLETLGLS